MLDLYLEQKIKKGVKIKLNWIQVHPFLANLFAWIIRQDEYETKYKLPCR